MSQRKQAKSAQIASGLNGVPQGLDRRSCQKAPESAPFYTVPSLPIPGRTSWSLAP